MTWPCISVQCLELLIKNYVKQSAVVYGYCRWKIHEAIFLALGKVPRMFVGAVQNGNVNFNLTDFLQNVVLSDLMLQGMYVYILTISAKVIIASLCTQIFKAYIA